MSTYATTREDQGRREEEQKVAKTRSSWWVLGYSKKKAMRSTGAAEAEGGDGGRGGMWEDRR